ncbi:hypothetical protein IKF81_03850 [Candidatus Saccharibacteria bacterium]|nr:hypothetical protein [Candidatus Saccharibacteria bacterium]
MSRKVNLNKISGFEPEKCWVGETQKICYGSKEEAEMAARVAEHDHHLKIRLSVYKCEFGNHWHLSSR